MWLFGGVFRFIEVEYVVIWGVFRLVEEGHVVIWGVFRFVEVGHVQVILEHKQLLICLNFSYGVLLLFLK